MCVSLMLMSIFSVLVYISWSAALRGMSSRLRKPTTQLVQDVLLQKRMRDLGKAIEASPPGVAVFACCPNVQCRVMTRTLISIGFLHEVGQLTRVKRSVVTLLLHTLVRRCRHPASTRPNGQYLVSSAGFPAVSTHRSCDVFSWAFHCRRRRHQAHQVHVVFEYSQ